MTAPQRYVGYLAELDGEGLVVRLAAPHDQSRLMGCLVPSFVRSRHFKVADDASKAYQQVWGAIELGQEVNFNLSNNKSRDAASPNWFATNLNKGGQFAEQPHSGVGDLHLVSVSGTTGLVQSMVIVVRHAGSRDSFYDVYYPIPTGLLQKSGGNAATGTRVAFIAAPDKANDNKIMVTSLKVVPYSNSR